MIRYDHIILGTGQATGTLLGGLLERDESIAVIEGGRLGGTCVNFGCTPTKTLVASARTAHVVARAPEYGIHTGEIDVVFSEIMSRMNKVRNESNQGLKEWIESEASVTLYRGWGRFTSQKTIKVGEEAICGEHIYINTGASARIPDIPGLDDVSWLDNRGILELGELPEHLLVVGGGYVALEFAQMFRRFGSAVTIIQRGNQLMTREDADVADSILDILTDEGVEILLDSSVVRASEAAGDIRLTVRKEAADFELSGSHMLLAVGRTPNSDKIGLDKAAIDVDARGYIVVDDHCRTSAEGVFAVGDVNGKGAFTHTSVNDAEIVLDLMRGGSRRISDRIQVYALFTDPPLGRVGLSEKAALREGHKVMKATRPMSKISRAKEMGETKGFAKLLVDGNTDLILGASILGTGADEIINMFAAYMYSGLPCHQYRKSVLVHPTISELMPWILDSLKPVN